MNVANAKELSTLPLPGTTGMNMNGTAASAISASMLLAFVAIAMGTLLPPVWGDPSSFPTMTAAAAAFTVCVRPPPPPPRSGTIATTVFRAASPVGRGPPGPSPVGPLFSTSPRSSSSSGTGRVRGRRGRGAGNRTDEAAAAARAAEAVASAAGAGWDALKDVAYGSFDLLSSASSGRIVGDKKEGDRPAVSSGYGDGVGVREAAMDAAERRRRRNQSKRAEQKENTRRYGRGATLYGKRPPPAPDAPPSKTGGAGSVKDAWYSAVDTIVRGATASKATTAKDGEGEDPSTAAAAVDRSLGLRPSARGPSNADVIAASDVVVGLGGPGGLNPLARSRADAELRMIEARRREEAAASKKGGVSVEAGAATGGEGDGRGGNVLLLAKDLSYGAFDLVRNTAGAAVGAPSAVADVVSDTRDAIREGAGRAKETSESTSKAVQDTLQAISTAPKKVKAVASKVQTTAREIERTASDVAETVRSAPADARRAVDSAKRTASSAADAISGAVTSVKIATGLAPPPPPTPREVLLRASGGLLLEAGKASWFVGKAIVSTGVDGARAVLAAARNDTDAAVAAPGAAAAAVATTPQEGAATPLVDDPAYDLEVAEALRLAGDALGREEGGGEKGSRSGGGEGGRTATSKGRSKEPPPSSPSAQFLSKSDSIDDAARRAKLSAAETKKVVGEVETLLGRPKPEEDTT